MDLLIAAEASSAMQFDQLQLISMGIGTLLPILVGLVTTRVTNAGVKASLLALLSAVAGFGTEYLGDPEAFVVTAALLNWLQTFIVAVAMHYGLWKPTTVADKAQQVPFSLMGKESPANDVEAYADTLVGDPVEADHDLRTEKFFEKEG